MIRKSTTPSYSIVATALPPRPALCGDKSAVHEAGRCGNCSIRHLTICGVFKPNELSHIERLMNAREMEAGQHLFEEGDSADFVYNMTAGTIRLYKLLPDGRRQITGFALPGDFLGLAARKGYAYSAEAIGHVALCRFKRRDLSELFGQFPEMEHRLLGVASDELVAAQDQMLLLGRKTPIEKVCSFLLGLHRRIGRFDAHATGVALEMTRSDIADFLGLTVETVSRTFSKLKKSGAIELPRADQVVIRNRMLLEQFAEDGEQSD